MAPVKCKFSIKGSYIGYSYIVNETLLEIPVIKSL